VPSVDVVDITVSIVVDAVPGNLILIDPDGICQVRMGGIDSGVDDGHQGLPLGGRLIVKLPSLIDDDVYTGYGVSGTLSEIASLQSGKGDCIHGSCFVPVNVKPAQGFQIQLRANPAEASFVFQCPLIIGKIISGGKISYPWAVVEETVGRGLGHIFRR